MYLYWDTFRLYLFIIGTFFILMLPINIPRRMKGKKFIFKWFYVPKGNRSRILFIHLLGLISGITFLLAHYLAFPIFLLLTWLGYAGDSSTNDALILILVIYLVTLTLNHYKGRIEYIINKNAGIMIKS